MFTFLELLCLIVIAVLLLPTTFAGGCSECSEHSLGDAFLPPKVTPSDIKTNKPYTILPSTQIPIKPAMNALKDKPSHFEKGNSQGRLRDPTTEKPITKPPRNWNYEIDPQVSKHKDDSHLDVYGKTDLTSARRY